MFCMKVLPVSGILEYALAGILVKAKLFFSDKSRTPRFERKIFVLENVSIWGLNKVVAWSLPSYMYD